MARRPRVLLNVLPLEDRTTPAVTADYLDGRVLFSLAPGADKSAVLASLQSSPLVQTTKELAFGIFRLDLKAGVTVPQALAQFSGNPSLGFVEPDYKLTKSLVPNDPFFTDGTLWAHRNTGQNGGTAGADARSINGWDFGTGSGQTVVAIIDDAFDFTHPDLAANTWTNPGEVPNNGIDDDGNGYVDDIHGWDFTRDSGDLLGGRTGDHGTHVAGTVGAVGDNGIGVTGMAWTTRMMSLPLFSSSGNSGAISVAVQAIGYAAQMGAKLSNNSWGYDGAVSLSLQTAIVGARNAGHIFVAAAGNGAFDNDTNDSFPTNFYGIVDNVVSVAAFDRNDKLASFSQWGRTKVTLGAPGVSIYSTEPNNTYGFKDGTSMATPQVTGALAVFWDANPDMTYDEVIAALKRSVRKIPAANDKTDTDGVLNLEALMFEGRTPVYATGAGEGGGPHVKVYRGRARFVTEFFAYSPAFTGGVRVATADVNGDGYTDVITVPGAGGGPHVKVFDGRTFKELYSFYAFEPSFFGGLFVAAGDVNGDGRADIIVSADRGGGPRVSVFSTTAGSATPVRIADFFAYDQAFTGGVRVAAGSFTVGSKRADVVTVPGFGGGPHVKVFRSADLLAGKTTAALQTFSGDMNDRNGLFVAAADFNNDGVADVVTGTGAGNPVVRIHDGRTMAPFRTIAPETGGEIPGLVNPGSSTMVGSPGTPTLSNGLIPPGITPGQLAYDGSQVKPGSLSGYMYGVRVAAQDLTGDKRPDLILASGPNTSPVVSLVNGVTFAEFRNYSPYTAEFYGGVFVGGAGI